MQRSVEDSSDLDVVVELSTNEREDDLFNAFNEDGLHIDEVKIDINPITAKRIGYCFVVDSCPFKPKRYFYEYELRRTPKSRQMWCFD